MGAVVCVLKHTQNKYSFSHYYSCSEGIYTYMELIQNGEKTPDYLSNIVGNTITPLDHFEILCHALLAVPYQQRK